MDYKDLFHKMVRLLSAPGKFWDELDEESGRNVQMGFVYPLIGLCGLSEFLGAFIGHEVSPEFFQWALTRCCAVAVALFGGFFLAAYLLGKIGRTWFRHSASREELLAFAGYSMVVVFVMNVVGGLYSIVILQWILQLYTIVVVFEGARRFLKVPERRLTGYTLTASVLILLSPALIEYIFNELTVILN